MRRNVLRESATFIDNPREIDLVRVRLATESYHQTEGEAMPVRRAKMLLHLVREMPIAIHRDEVIVGDRSLLPAPWDYRSRRSCELD